MRSFLISALIVVCFSGCGGGSSSNQTAGPDQAPGTSPPVNPSAPTGGGGSNNGTGGGGGSGTDGSCSSTPGSCTLASSVQSPDAVTAYGGLVYYGTESGSVVQLPIDGTQSTTLSTGEGKVRRIQVDNSGVYWVAGQNLRTLAAGSSTPTTLYTASNELVDLALDSSHVYVTSGATGNIYQVAKNGALHITLVSGQSDTFAIASDGYALYWSNASTGTINTTVISTGITKTIATGEGNPVQIALSPSAGGATPTNPSSTVYWVDYLAGSSAGPGVRQQGVFCGDGSCTQIFGSTQKTLYGNNEVGPWALAVDDVNVYWANSFNGTVNEASLAGPNVGVLASGLNRPSAIAADGTFVYYAADASPGTVARVSP